MRPQELERKVSMVVGDLAARYPNLYDRATPDYVRDLCRRLILEDLGEREPVPDVFRDAFR